VVARGVLVHDKDERRRVRGCSGSQEVEQLGFEVKPLGVRKRRRVEAPKQPSDHATVGHGWLVGRSTDRLPAFDARLCGARFQATTADPGRWVGMPTIDGIRGTQRYDHQDDERIVPPKKERPSPEAMQARFIASEHPEMQYPPELFAGLGKKPDTTALPESAGADTKPTADAARTAPAVGATAAKSSAGLFTTNPAEVARVNTQPSPSALLALVKAHFPGISDDAALTMLSQSSFECGGWKACWNNNLGNVKEPDANKPHFYIVPLPEAVTPAYADQLVKSGHGRIASDEDVKKWGLTAGPGMVKVIITAPIAGNRFKAVPRMEDGFQAWVGHMKNKCEKDPAMKEAIMSGDCRGFAAALKKQGYFTGDSNAYGAGMEAHKRALAKKLGVAS